MSKEHETQKKILFKLEKDEDDYPPNEWESLWATEIGSGHYVIDNIPFFVRDVSCGDTVSVIENNGELFFDDVVEESLNSVLRVIAYDPDHISELRERLLSLKCESELSHIPNLIAVEVPAAADLDSVLKFLDEGEKDQLWEYETASIRN